MRELTTLPIGRRVRLIRRARGMSQVTLAGLVGRSEAWIQQVEAGKLPLDRVSVILRLAEALNVAPAVLLGQPFILRNGNAREVPGVPAIRAAVLHYDIPGFRQETARLRPLGDLARDVARAHELRQAARYFDLAIRLPQLLAETRVAVREHQGEQRDRALGLLARTYQAAMLLLYRLGETDLAFAAAARSRDAAEQAGDPLLVGVSAWYLSIVLLGSGRREEARAVPLAAADQLSRALDRAAPKQVAVYGALMLKAAGVSSRMEDRLAVRDYLREAGRAAEILGRDRNDYAVPFGPSDCAIHRVACAVELGDAGQALHAAEELDPAGLPAAWVERRAHHDRDVARALVMRGRGEQAVAQLLKVERYAPEELRYNPLARELVLFLLERERHVTSELRGLATRAGILPPGGSS